MSRFLKTLTELTLDDIPLAGGKACRLGELARAGLPVPRGAVVLTAAYEAFMEANGLGARLAAAAARGRGGRLGPAELEELRKAIAAAPLPDGLAAELQATLERCGLPPGTPLAVRSSSPGEDAAYRSRAGAYESRLNVVGTEEVLAAIRECWASLWTERAQAYGGKTAAGDPPAAGPATGPVTGPADPGALPAGPGPRPAMAVLVQELIPCEVAGILFTLNPLTADENEMLVEATWGLAAELASGEVSPDRFVVDFWDGSARRTEIGRKPEALRAAPGGGLERGPVGGERAGAACLDAPRLADLAAVGRRVQEVFGHPQDVEFGFAADPAAEPAIGGPGDPAPAHRLYVFQARPITAYSFPPEVGQWTTANFREVMPGFASILGQSQSFHHDFARAQEELFRRVKLWRREDEGTVWARTFFGHGYWNVGATKRAAARIPGYNERSFDRTVGIDPVYGGDGQVTPWNVRTIAGAVPVLFALSRQYRRVPKEAETFLRWFDREEPGWDAIRPADLDDGALAERVRWGLDLHWRANRWALLTTLLSTQAQEDFHRTLAGLEAKAARARARSEACAGASSGARARDGAEAHDGIPELPSEARLMTGLTGMATARPLHDMWKLAESLGRHPEVLRTLAQTSPSELAPRLRELAARGPGAEGWREILDWIDRYRYMANIDEDLAVPRWSEDPSVPLSILRGYLADRRGPGEPAEQVERQRAIREEEEAKARAAGRRWLILGLDPFWFGRFAKQYALVKSLCWWREETRVYLSRARYHCRRFLVEQANRWAARGHLADATDIFWLTREEVLELVSVFTGETGPSRGGAAAGETGRDRGSAAAAGDSGGPTFAAAREAARRRRSVAHLYRGFAVPPNILPGSFGPDGLPKRASPNDRPGRDIPATVGWVQVPAGGRVLRGTGCSAGIASGRVRVAHGIEEAATLQAGEILVAPHANPAWVPLFHLAAGLVLEEGGLLSHSAVVAREYGVPAVLQVKGATSLLRTGDTVTIDGGDGTVAVLRRPNGVHDLPRRLRQGHGGDAEPSKPRL